MDSRARREESAVRPGHGRWKALSCVELRMKTFVLMSGARRRLVPSYSLQ